MASVHHRRHRVRHALTSFGHLAWNSNITGLASMLAYTMLLGVVPVALLGLFVAGHVLSSPSVMHSIEVDLQDIFPGSTHQTLQSLLKQVATSTTGTGILALVASIWLASSFWGALDTSFSRIYNYPSRPWLQQKRFGVTMVGVVLLFMFATVLIHHRVPNRAIPWRSVWPGTLAATIAIGAIDYGFPLYLSSISTIDRFSSTVVFIVIVLGWFYLVAIIILSGAVINAALMG
jgi:membrane protein